MAVFETQMVENGGHAVKPSTNPTPPQGYQMKFWTTSSDPTTATEFVFHSTPITSNVSLRPYATLADITMDDSHVDFTNGEAEFAITSGFTVCLIGIYTGMTSSSQPVLTSYGKITVPSVGSSAKYVVDFPTQSGTSSAKLTLSRDTGSPNMINAELSVQDSNGSVDNTNSTYDLYYRWIQE